MIRRNIVNAFLDNHEVIETMLKGRVEGDRTTWGLRFTLPFFRAPYWAQQDDSTQYLPQDPSITIPGILDHLQLDDIPETLDREALGALDCLNAGVRVLYEKKATSVLVKEVNHSNKVTSNHFSWVTRFNIWSQLSVWVIKL